MDQEYRSKIRFSTDALEGLYSIFCNPKVRDSHRFRFLLCIGLSKLAQMMLLTIMRFKFYTRFASVPLLHLETEELPLLDDSYARKPNFKEQERLLAVETHQKQISDEGKLYEMINYVPKEQDIRIRGRIARGKVKPEIESVILQPITQLLISRCYGTNRHIGLKVCIPSQCPTSWTQTRNRKRLFRSTSLWLKALTSLVQTIFLL